MLSKRHRAWGPGPEPASTKPLHCTELSTDVDSLGFGVGLLTTSIPEDSLAHLHWCYGSPQHQSNSQGLLIRPPFFQRTLMATLIVLCKEGRRGTLFKLARPLESVLGFRVKGNPTSTLGRELHCRMLCHAGMFRVWGLGSGLSVVASGGLRFGFWVSV